MTTLATFVLVVAAVVVMPLLPVAALLALADSLQRRRARVIAAQVRLTDVIHREFGAIAAPLVQKRPWGAWRIVMTLPPERLAAAGRLVALANEVVRDHESRGDRVQVVFRGRRAERTGPLTLLTARSH